MTWFKKEIPKVSTETQQKHDMPEGVWVQCEGCQAALYKEELDKNQQVCHKCGCHLYYRARERLHDFFDEGVCAEIGAEVRPKDRLHFKDTKSYQDRLTSSAKQVQEQDALVAGWGKLLGAPLVACAFEYRFIGGSMGAVVGERFVLAVEEALRQACPLVCFTASGGARMQEGLISLMQMAKTAAALKKLDAASLPYIVVLTNPTMGGVSASLGMLGDIIMAEPGALIGFAGPRVIEQTVRQVLPPGFQSSEFLFKSGAIDMICERRHLREKIGGLLAKLARKS